MNVKIYKLTCLTNMHVGSGDINYSIVDNEVMKDEILGSPIIPSSGVKGCISKFCEEKLDKVKHADIFGVEEKNELEEGKNIKTPSKKGNVKFLNAELFAKPMRVTEGIGAYAMVMSDALRDRFNMLMKELGQGNLNVTSCENTDADDDKTEIVVENTDADDDNAEIVVENNSRFTKKDKLSISSEKFHEKIYLSDSKSFNQVDLPVTARNKLNENGTSENLWYEEYVPHESIFYLPIISEDEELLKVLDKAINDQIIQFGKNASIGFGLCKVENIIVK